MMRINNSENVRHYTLDVNHADWQNDLANIKEEIKREDGTFGESLRRFKNSNGMSTLKALLDCSGMNRDMVQRIRDDRDGKTITKRAAISIVVAAQAPLPFAQDMLKAAGFCLSPSILYDRIIMYFIKHEDFDFVDINQCLRHFGFDKKKYWLGSNETRMDIEQGNI